MRFNSSTMSSQILGSHLKTSHSYHKPSKKTQKTFITVHKIPEFFEVIPKFKHFKKIPAIHLTKLYNFFFAHNLAHNLYLYIS